MPKLDLRKTLQAKVSGGLVLAMKGAAWEEWVLPVADGLVCRFEADTGVIYDVDGISCVNWTDSVSGNVLTARGTVPQKGTSPSGRTKIVVRSGGDFYNATGTVGLPSGSVARSVFFCVNHTNPVVNRYCGFTYGTAAAARMCGLIVGGNNSVNNWIAHGYSTGDLQASSTYNPIGHGWAVHNSVNAGGTNGLISHYLDDVLMQTGNKTLDTGNAVMAVGVNETGATNTRRTLDCCAALIYDRALDSTERALVVSYLRNKYLV